ncbi:Os12g0125550 [Oryza sativa Japonica Group]|uniref:Os12g0125550 protein n=1 Tax=Oryza sativa subsp. japonica TaxID=39947 RepID=A0A0P0Y719_ORYSJ|nr:hypothetical protein EE612_057514 [Oryza sativa]BAT15689.1 Os12g0125550 [Oryza sativa Japonica Group]
MYARLPRKKRKSTKNTNPIKKEVVTTLKMANIALLALPAPSSFATRTLKMYIQKSNRNHHLPTIDIKATNFVSENNSAQ